MKEHVVFRARRDWKGRVLAGGRVGDTVGDGAEGERWGQADGEEGIGIIYVHTRLLFLSLKRKDRASVLGTAVRLLSLGCRSVGSHVWLC